MPVIEIKNEGGIVQFSAPVIPAVMSGDCTDFRAWLVTAEESETVLRATFLSGGRTHVVDIPKPDYLVSIGGDGRHREVKGDGLFRKV